LFGHEKGSFTGAFAQKRGKFEVADGGTLFLDEIGDMRLDLQPKLLTAIENGCIQRLGGLTDIHVDARVIAATNKDLRAEVERGAFRQDLYYRLCTTSIVLPPLRERTEDIPLLIRNFIKSMAAVAVRGIPGKTVVTGISPEAESILCNHPWPGNIRELKNVIAHALLFTPGDTIQPEDLAIAPSGPQPIAVSAPAAAEVLPEFETMDEVVRRTKREYVLSAHKRVKGNPTALAKMIPIHRKGLPRFLDSLGLSHLKQPRRGAKPTLPNS
jgi:DNA-binding NtrC family response regulator